MTPENISIAERFLLIVLEGDRPFMALFTGIMIVVIVMAFRAMTYVRNLSHGHKDQLTLMNMNLVEQRKEHYDHLAVERSRSDKREDSLFANMEKNTEQLTDIASTLKEVQYNFGNLERKVTENFDFLSSEIDNVKTHVSIKTTTTTVQNLKDPES